MNRRSSNRRHRLALLTHGLELGGGVPSVARWLRDSLSAVGDYDIDVIDLATSRKDPHSRRLADVRSWIRPTLQERRGPNYYQWGANAVELEFMRYRPRRELTRFLQQYDLIQVVAGSPAWAGVTTGCGVPTVLQAATTMAWERQASAATANLSHRLWQTAMTGRTTVAETAAVRQDDVVLVENRAMLEHVRHLGQRQVLMAPPGIDVNGFKPHRDGWRRNGYLLSVCRLGDPRKGLDRLVRAYGLMQQLRIDVPPLVLAGRGSLTDSVAREIDKLGNGARVIVESDVRATDLPALYQGASVFLQASHEEGLGLSLLEAMASALPVVATETAGSRETVVDGVTGWLISQARESDIPAAFAQRALQLLDVHTNDFGLKGHHRCVTTFSTAATLKKFTETYASLIPRR